MKAQAILSLASAAACLANTYQLHEWGTFTTVSGSDGVLLEGLQREEEFLPPYVYSHFGMENGQVADPAEYARIRKIHGTAGFSPHFTKGVGRRPVAGVTVKMETPVIYFHSEEKEAFPVHVKVGFEGGTISQWYPQRSAGERLPEPPPPLGPVVKPTPLAAWTLDFSKPWRGSIEWQVEVLPPAANPILFKPGDNVGWLRARQPMTNAIRTSNGETEGYLFYRGIGRFDPGLQTTVDGSETLQLINQSGGNIPYALVFEQNGNGIRWAELSDGIAPWEYKAIPESKLKPISQKDTMEIYQAMATGLEKQGLTRAEARSMVETWWTSYFSTPGLRVFWVVPRSATDRILPLEPSPAPASIVRVLVGRSEVLRPRQEKEWLALSQRTGNEAAHWEQLVFADRFGLAVEQRVKALSAATVNR